MKNWKFLKNHIKSLQKKLKKPESCYRKLGLQKKTALSAENLNDTVTAGAGKVVTTYKILCILLLSGSCNKVNVSVTERDGNK